MFRVKSGEFSQSFSDYELEVCYRINSATVCSDKRLAVYQSDVPGVQYKAIDGK